MGNSITIVPIRKQGADPRTLAGSLERNGLSRAPGCKSTVPPYMEIDGTIRTGLDENALYINKLPAEEQDIERARVRELRKKLEAATGLDLGPRSPYYTQMGDDKYGTPQRARMARLNDDEMVFDFSDPQLEIMAAWLRVHPLVAPSQEHARRGLSGAQVQYYVKNPEVEMQMEFQERQKVNSAVVKLNEMTPSNRKRIARLLDLPVQDDSPEENVYNLIDAFIKEKEVKIGPYKGRRPISVFNDILEMKEETLMVKDLVKQSITTGIYRKYKGVVFEGEIRVADTEADLVKDLIVDTQGRIALEAKVKSKKIVNE